MTAIDEIIASSIQPSDLIDKINELVRACNTLESNLDGEWTKTGTGATLFSDLSLNYASNYMHALTGILPNDNEMIVSARITPDATSGRQSYCRANIAIDGQEKIGNQWNLRLGENGLFIGNVRNRGFQDYIEGNGILIAKRTDKLWISRSESIYGKLLFSIIAYRKVR